MPHPALLSFALYSIPTLPNELTTLGYVPGAPGYATLHRELGKGIRAPNVRTVQKMLHRRELAKWSVCNGIVQLLNQARGQKGLPLLDAALIEEHEFYLENIASVLDRIRRNHGVNAQQARAAIAAHCDKPVGLIRAMVKKYRTTYDRCMLIQEAFKRLYGETVEISNEPYLIRSGRPKRAVKSIRPADR